MRRGHNISAPITSHHRHTCRVFGSRGTFSNGRNRHLVQHVARGNVDVRTVGITPGHPIRFANFFALNTSGPFVVIRGLSACSRVIGLLHNHGRTGLFNAGINNIVFNNNYGTDISRTLSSCLTRVNCHFGCICCINSVSQRNTHVIRRAHGTGIIRVHLRTNVCHTVLTRRGHHIGTNNRYRPTTTGRNIPRGLTTAVGSLPVIAHIRFHGILHRNKHVPRRVLVATSCQSNSSKDFSHVLGG